MTEREKLLGRVRMYDFALVDVIQYLDGHPKNTAALAYYSEMRTAFDKAAAEYGCVRPADRPRGGYPRGQLALDRRPVAVGRRG